jgi:ABC-type uncharacterized transport system permease subunit
MQRDAAVPSTLVSVIESLLILAVVSAQALRRRRADGSAAIMLPVPARGT